MFFKSLCPLLTLALLTGSGVLFSPLVAQAQPAPQEQPLSVAKQNLVKRSTQFIDYLNAGQSAQAYQLLPQQLQNYWTPKTLQALWEEDFIEDSGAFKKVLKSQVLDVVNANIVKMSVQFERRSQEILFTYNGAQELIAISWTNRKTIPETVQEFFQALSNQDYGRARGYFSPLLKTEILPERVEKSWNQGLNINGAYKGIKSIDVQSSGIAGVPDVAIVTVEFAQRHQDFFLFFDNNRKIVNLDFVRN
jgi:hypothetical protein